MFYVILDITYPASGTVHRRTHFIGLKDIQDAITCAIAEAMALHCVGRSNVRCVQAGIK